MQDINEIAEEDCFEDNFSSDLDTLITNEEIFNVLSEMRTEMKNLAEYIKNLSVKSPKKRDITHLDVFRNKKKIQDEIYSYSKNYAKKMGKNRYFHIKNNIILHEADDL